MSNKKLQYGNFEIKAVDFNNESDELVIKGYASVFNVEDSLNPSYHQELKQMVLAKDVVQKGAFAKTISERKERIAICKNHNINNPVGKLIEAKEDDYGLFCEIRISDAEPELKTKLRENIYNEFSFGFTVVQSTMESKGDGTYVRRISELKLYEISIVTVGRHPDAKITEKKGLEFAENLIDSLIDTEKKEERKFQLLQLKSLVLGEPNEDSLIVEKPKLDVNELKSVVRELLK